MKIKLPFLTIGLSLLFLNMGYAQCDGADFEEVNGIAVLEMEAATQLASGWNRETIARGAGFTGSSFLAFRGTNSFPTPRGFTTFSYTVRINNAGVYRFQWRNRVGIGNNPTEHNDSWLRFTDAYDFFGQRGTSIVYPRGGTFRRGTELAEGASANGFMKTYATGNASTWTWTTFTSDFSPHSIMVEFQTPGVYTIEVSGRSNAHLIDRMVLYNPNQFTEAQATNIALNPTDCSSDEEETPPEDEEEEEETPPAPVDLSISSFQYVNADADQIVGTIANGGTIDLADVDGAELNFIAVTDPATLGSVEMQFTGGPNVTFTDNAAPYAAFGNSGANFFGRTLVVGNYTLTATPYESANLGGQQGDASTISFTVVDTRTPPEDEEEEEITPPEDEEEEEETPPAPVDLSISSFQYVNADADQIVGTIANGGTIDLADVDGAELNFVAVTDPATLGSVEMQFTGGPNVTLTDNAAPYAAFGNSGANFFGRTIVVGNYTLTATPYESANLGGQQGDASTITFTVVDTRTPPEDEEEEEVTPPEDEEEEEEETPPAPVDLSISSFQYVNADADQIVGTIANGGTIDLADVDGAELNFIAVTDPATLGSVGMQFTGGPNVTLTDNVAPYAAFGNSGANFFGRTIVVGNYTLTATPYESADLGGQQGDASTISFTVVDTRTPPEDEEEEEVTPPEDEEEEEEETPPAPVDLSISSFQYVNADADQIVGTIANGGTIDLAEIDGAELNFIAVTDPATLGSVGMQFTGGPNVTLTDNVAPYAAFGNSGANFFGRTLVVGNYTLTATPYESADLGGQQGDASTISFTVVDTRTPPEDEEEEEVTPPEDEEEEEEETPPEDEEEESATFDIVLVNADTDRAIANISNGSSFDESTLPFNLAIVVEAATVGVAFDLSGPISFSNSEGNAPFSIFGDIGLDIQGRDFPVGDYTLTVRTFGGATGNQSRTVSFSITGDDSNFFLVNADTDAILRSLRNGETLSVSESTGMNIAARPDVAGVRSAELEITGPTSTRRIENVFPYAIFGDIEGDYLPGSLAPGNYTLSVQFYADRNGRGSVLSSSTIQFSVAGGNARQSLQGAIAFPNPMVGTAVNVQIPSEVSGTFLGFTLNTATGAEISRGIVTMEEIHNAGDILRVVAPATINSGVYYLTLTSSQERKTIALVKE